MEAAGLDQLYPDAGPAWRPGAVCLATHPDSAARELGPLLVREGRPMFSVPDAWVTATVEAGPWLDRKIEAVFAHRAEVARGALPGRLAELPPEERRRLMATEWFIRHDSAATHPQQTELTA